jgi:hypothetical protein
MSAPDAAGEFTGGLVADGHGGYRGTIDLLSAGESEQVRSENVDVIRRENIRAVEANVLYGQASA